MYCFDNCIVLASVLTSVITVGKCLFSITLYAIFQLKLWLVIISEGNHCLPQVTRKFSLNKICSDERLTAVSGNAFDHSAIGASPYNRGTIMQFDQQSKSKWLL